jgi:hypothetical protein
MRTSGTPINTYKDQGQYKKELHFETVRYNLNNYKLRFST